MILTYFFKNKLKTIKLIKKSNICLNKIKKELIKIKY